MNFKMIRYSVGMILLFETAFLLVPLITAVIYGEIGVIFALVATMLLCASIGTLSYLAKPQDMSLYTRDGFVIVALSWISLSVFGTLPFLLSGAIPSFIDALFETVSGFTTTGSSILTNVEILPKSLLMWRSFTHWIGGMGVLVFVMAILPLGGGQSMHIMRAESPGPEVSKLVPRMTKTARLLYAIYFVMTLIQFLILLPDMSVFDALNTAFATAGTGGFGLRNDSMASFSPYVQIVCTVFMILFSINFNSYFLMLRLKFKEAFNTEVKVFLLIVFGAIAIITVNLLTLPEPIEGAETFADALRHAAFSVASLISTSGFATADFNLWPTLSKTILVLIMFVGACAGSTGGGFKVSRIIILFKGAMREIGSIIHPHRVKKITIDDKPVSSEVTRSVNAYLVIYVLVFALSLLVLTFDPYVPAPGMDEMTTNFTAVTAAINNIGPGLDMVGPTGNFAFFSPLSKLVLTFDMLAGRLELLPMLLLFTPSSWKRRN